MKPKIRFRLMNGELQLMVKYIGDDGLQHVKFEIITDEGTMPISVIEDLIALMRSPEYLNSK